MKYCQFLGHDIISFVHFNQRQITDPQKVVFT